jgi:AcrR family transcriptional regulator
MAQSPPTPDPTRPKARRSSTLPKPTQRERLVTAMIELCAQRGYHAVSIAEVSSRARVSSATFYELFEDKEACLLAAYEAAAARLLEPLPLTGETGWPSTFRRTIETLLDGFARHPDAGRVLLIDARAAGPRLHRAREGVADGFGRRLEEVLNHPSEKSLTLDIPAVALVGGVRAILARHLRACTEHELRAQTPDLLAWLASYAIPDSSERWSSGASAMLRQSPIRRGASAPETPVRLPRGRHGLPAGVVARSRRTRLIYATAEVTMLKGYTSATVADIVAAAGVSRDVFYEHFNDKEHAFLEAQQHPTQHILDECARAFFTNKDWPHRVWEGLKTLLSLIIANPAISHLRLVECYDVGPAAIRHAEEITRSFTVFIQEGYGQSPRARKLPGLCSEAIGGAIFEMIQRYIARGDADGLWRALPQLVYIVIAPFTGPQQAALLVDQMSDQANRRRRVRSP